MNATPSACACIVAALESVDPPAEDLLDELRRLQLREPFELEAAHQPHSLHVGDQRDGLR